MFKRKKRVNGEVFLIPGASWRFRLHRIFGKGEAVEYVVRGFGLDGPNLRIELVTVEEWDRLKSAYTYDPDATPLDVGSYLLGAAVDSSQSSMKEID